MKQVVVKRTVLMVVIGLLAFPTALWGAVRNPFVFPHAGGKNLDLSAIEKIRPKQELARIQTENYIPTNLAPSADTTYVATRIISHSVGKWLESPHLRRTSFGSAAYQINESMNTRVSFKADDSDLKHDVQFQVRAAETVAAIKYEGYLNAQLAYRLDNKNANFEVTKSLDGEATLVFNHSDVPGEKKDLLSLRWVF